MCTYLSLWLDNRHTWIESHYAFSSVACLTQSTSRVSLHVSSCSSAVSFRMVELYSLLWVHQSIAIHFLFCPLLLIWVDVGDLLIEYFLGAELFANPSWWEALPGNKETSIPSLSVFLNISLAFYVLFNFSELQLLSMENLGDDTLLKGLL